MKESPFIAVLNESGLVWFPGAFILRRVSSCFVLYLLYGYNFW